MPHFVRSYERHGGDWSSDGLQRRCVCLAHRPYARYTWSHALTLLPIKVEGLLGRRYPKFGGSLQTPVYSLNVSNSPIPRSSRDGHSVTLLDLLSVKGRIDVDESAGFTRNRRQQIEVISQQNVAAGTRMFDIERGRVCGHDQV